MTDSETMDSLIPSYPLKELCRETDTLVSSCVIGHFTGSTESYASHKDKIFCSRSADGFKNVSADPKLTPCADPILTH
jgi:hypothetical protein